MTGTKPVTSVVSYEPSLGRLARTGTWDELAKGTFRSAAERATAGEWEAAAVLVEVSVVEADELRDVYERWPVDTLGWIRDRGTPPAVVDASLARLTDLIGQPAMNGIQSEWPLFKAAAERAAHACRTRQPSAVAEIEHARLQWQGVHDRAVDRVSGVIDIAVSVVGEDSLGDLWNFLMDDWYELHERRYDLATQPWSDSAHQLMIAIVDGFHAHLTGTARQGDIEIIEEQTRIGFRFAPCGSGGRSLDPRITGDAPRAAPPFGFAVTTTAHDWAWNTVGICSYCVHCCLLNEVMPIDRLGFPTRVIDAPTWNAANPVTTCTWWVYRDPADVPDHIYQRVGRDPSRRPAKQGASHD
jgi:hypothetical protein